MYKNDLALNDLQWLICHKTKPNKIKPHTHTYIIEFCISVNKECSIVVVEHIYLN